MGRGGGEGRVPSLMAAAVEREVSDYYFFFSSLMCIPWDMRLKRGRYEVCMNFIILGIFFGKQSNAKTQPI